MLLKGLPRLGLIVETCQLLETAREMERNNPVGPGAVTEFDELFKIGYRAIVECLAVNAEWWRAGSDEKESAHSGELVSLLEKITESLLVDWLAHSRTLRLVGVGKSQRQTILGEARRVRRTLRRRFVHPAISQSRQLAGDPAPGSWRVAAATGRTMTTQTNGRG